MKRLHLTILIAALCGATLFTGCQNQTDPLGSDTTPEYFPNSVGDHWQYMSSDSLSSLTFRKTSEIVADTTILNGMSVSILENTHSHLSNTDTGAVTMDYVDTQFVYVDKDSLVVFGHYKTPDLVRQYKLLLPLVIGERVLWNVNPDERLGQVISRLNGDSEILGRDSMQVDAGMYSEVYEVMNIADVGNGAQWETSCWIAPGVGIITLSTIACDQLGGNDGAGGCKRVEHWELQSFTPAAR